MELLSGHEKIITKSGISLNAGTLNRGFTVYIYRPTVILLPGRTINPFVMLGFKFQLPRTEEFQN
jgi:hypothetical protein